MVPHIYTLTHQKLVRILAICILFFAVSKAKCCNHFERQFESFLEK